MLNDEQRRVFHEDGFLHLPGAVDADAVEYMRERIWRRLEHNGARRDDPSTWAAGQASKLQTIRKGDPDPHDNPTLTGAFDDLLGEGCWRTGSHWGQALVTFPTGPEWSLPHRPWHLDHPYWYPRDVIWGVNVFLFVDDVEPRGGGTLVVRGSPLLTAAFIDRLRPAQRTQKQLRHAFDAQHAWFRALTDPADTDDRVARFMDEATEVEGVATQVVELTGRAGDAVICHPWTIHNGAPNALDRPRMMRACRAFHRDFISLTQPTEPDG